MLGNLTKLCSMCLTNNSIIKTERKDTAECPPCNGDWETQLEETATVIDRGTVASAAEKSMMVDSPDGQVGLG